MTLRSLRRVRASEYRALLLTAAAVPLVHLSLRVWDFARVCAWLTRHPAVLPPAPLRTTDAVADSVRALGRAKRYGPYGGNCLSQSLALWWRLRRCGIATELRLGAHVANGTLAAHAWVEYDGRVLNDTPDVSSRYAPLEHQAPSRLS